MNLFSKTLSALALGAILVGGAATAADRDWTKYDGSVSIDATNFALVFGGSTGGGKVTFKDKTYDFKISGLSAGINVAKHEIQNSKQYQNPNIECSKQFKISSIRYSNLFRISIFGFRISP